MVNVFRIKPQDGFIKKIAEFIVSYENPCEFTVVFPNNRALLYLKKYLSSSKKLFPRMFSIDEFIREAFFIKSDYTEADFYDVFNIFATVLKDDLLEICSRKEMGLYEIMELSSCIWKEFEELKINMVEGRKLKDYDFMLNTPFLNNLFEESKIVSKFPRYSHLYERFYSELERRKLTTRAVMYMQTAIDNDAFNNFDNIIFAGFFLTSKSEKEIFKKISLKKNTYFFFQDNPLLDDAIDFVKLPPSDLKEFSLNFTVKPVSSKHTEVFALKQDINNLQTPKIDNSLPHTAIILPDSSTLIPVIENVLCDVVNYNITIPFSLENTPWMSMFRIIAEIHEKRIDKNNRKLYPVKKIKSLLSHQWIKDIFRSSNFNNVDRFEVFVNEDEISQKFFSNTEEGEKFVSNFIKSFGGVKDIESFLIAILNIIRIVQTDEDDTFKSLGKIIEVELDKVVVKDLSKLSFQAISEYFAFLEKLLSQITFPFKGEPLEAFQCMGVLEARLLDFENLFIVDLNEGIIPALEKYVFFLSEPIRKALGLPLFSQRFNLYYYHITNIIASAKKTILYYIENKNMTKSPILEKMIWEKEKKEKRIMLEENIIYPKTNFKTHKPQRIEKTQKVKQILKNFSFSPSSFDLYIECPVKFYFTYVVGIKEDSRSDYIEKSDIGKLFHAIIESVFKRYIGRSISELNAQAISDDFETETENKIKMFDESSPQTYFIRYQIRKKAKELSEFIINSFKAFVIEKVEFFLEKHITTPLGKIKINGRADLVLSSSSQTLIVDFKTSSDLTPYLTNLNYFNNNSLALRSVQLPFYLMVFNEKFNNCTNCCVISLGSKKCGADYLYQDQQQYSKYQSIIETYIISTITNEIITKDYFEPSQDPPCDKCNYRDICSI